MPVFETVPVCYCDSLAFLCCSYIKSDNGFWEDDTCANVVESVDVPTLGVTCMVHCSEKGVKVLIS